MTDNISEINNNASRPRRRRRQARNNQNTNNTSNTNRRNSRPSRRRQRSRRSSNSNSNLNNIEAPDQQSLIQSQVNRQSRESSLNNQEPNDEDVALENLNDLQSSQQILLLSDNSSTSFSDEEEELQFVEEDEDSDYNYNRRSNRRTSSSRRRKKRRSKNGPLSQLLDLSKPLAESDCLSEYDYVYKVDDRFCCVICTEVLIDPVVTFCQHTFCRHCLAEQFGSNKEKKCPICRQNLKRKHLRRPSMILKNLLDEIEVQCPNSKNCCKFKTNRGKLSQHLKKECCGRFCKLGDHEPGLCLHERLNCLATGCDQIGERCLMTQHVDANECKGKGFVKQLSQNRLTSNENETNKDVKSRQLTFDQQQRIRANYERALKLRKMAADRRNRNIHNHNQSQTQFQSHQQTHHYTQQRIDSLIQFFN